MAKSSLFNRIRSAMPRGVDFSTIPDEQLLKMHKAGDPNALMEYANRHQDDFFYGTSKRGGERENAGQMWLDMHKAAQEFDPNRGASARTFMNNRVKQEELNRWSKQRSRNNVAGEVNVDDFSGASNTADTHVDVADKNMGYDLIAAGKSKSDFQATERERELNDLLDKILVNSDENTRNLINAYRKADKNLAVGEQKRFDDMLASGQDAKAQMKFRGSKDLNDGEAARVYGTSTANMNAKRKSAISRLPPRLMQEALKVLRGE